MAGNTHRTNMPFKLYIIDVKGWNKNNPVLAQHHHRRCCYCCYSSDYIVLHHAVTLQLKLLLWLNLVVLGFTEPCINEVPSAHSCILVVLDTHGCHLE